MFQLPSGFQPTDEWAHGHLGMSLAQYYSQNPQAQQAVQQQQQQQNLAQDPLYYVKQAQQLQVQANQPAIQTLQTQQTNLGSAYSDLLKSVLQQGTVASNYAQVGENTLLGQRGITDNTSPLFQQQMAQALLPVTAQNQAAAGSVGVGSAQDLNQLATQIASLQAGNVPGALSYGQNISGLQNALQVAQTQATAKPFTSATSITAPVLNQVTGALGLF